MDQLKIDFDKVIEGLKLSDENINFRKKNFDQFVENGFPNKRVEDWKFSDLNQIISSNIKNLLMKMASSTFPISSSLWKRKFSILVEII